MKVTDLKPLEYDVYYKMYIDAVPTDISLLEGFSKGSDAVLNFFRHIPNHKLETSYETGKWTIKEVFQHIIDTERILIYRCLRIARHDQTNLPGFNQDDYVGPSKANLKTLEDLVEEYEAVRNSSIVFIKSLSAADFKQKGMVSGGAMSARAAAFIILGHESHHVNMIKSRYL